MHTGGSRTRSDDKRWVLRETAAEALAEADRPDGGGRRAGVPRDGDGALTPAEARVADLLAGGATKQQAAARLFVSFHTVDTHLRSIYAKLGIRSRIELARIWDARPRGH
jgi:DNA-binding CsgD family transcriptional regulator